MRASAWFTVAALAACHPSATVERTMPVADLQSYHTVALRVRSTAFAAQGEAMYLQTAVLQDLQQRCGFERVGVFDGSPADVLLDLNVTGAGRGGTGWIQNQNEATLDTLLVLSDGQTGELLGTARIHGKSSGMIINNQAPETEAVAVVAKTVADLLAKSGCTGPRVARAEPPAPAGSGAGSAAEGSGAGSSAAGSGSAVAGTGSGSGSGTGGPPPVDDAHRAQAEAIDEQGKEKLRSADIAGALADFQQANSIAPDARYEFNICLTLEAQEKWNDALASCKQARAMNPEPRLMGKIDHRIELIQARK